MTEFKLDRDNEYKLENQEELRFEVENDEKVNDKIFNILIFFKWFFNILKIKSIYYRLLLN